MTGVGVAVSPSFARGRAAAPLLPVLDGLAWYVDADKVTTPASFTDATGNRTIQTAPSSAAPAKSGDLLSFASASSQSLEVDGFRIDGSIGNGEFTFVVRCNPASASLPLAGGEAATPRLYFYVNSWAYNTNATVSWTGVAGDQVLSYVRGPADVFVRRDGTELDRAAIAKVSLPAGNDFLIGELAGQYFNGTLAGAAFYSRALSTSELAAVEAAL